MCAARLLLISTLALLSTGAPAEDAAPVGLHASDAGRIQARRLREAKSAFQAKLALRDIAELGPDGRDAGEEVLRFLLHDDWEVRVAAARTLGFIDYQPSVPLLINAINEPSDVRLNWAAVQSLGRLRNKTAVSHLQRAASQHWYVPVRREASEALSHIRDGSSYESKHHPKNFPFEFFAYQHIAAANETCHAIGIPLLPEAQARKLRASSEEVGKLKSTRLIPDLALRITNGWIAGTNRGEWGGELVFIGDDGSQRVLLEENVHEIVWLGPRIVVLTGLAHLWMNEGVIYELRTNAAGQWGATPWRALPGQPKHWFLLENGELMIDAVMGGTILVSPEGSMRTACDKVSAVR